MRYVSTLVLLAVSVRTRAKEIYSVVEEFTKYALNTFKRHSDRSFCTSSNSKTANRGCVGPLPAEYLQNFFNV